MNHTARFTHSKYIKISLFTSLLIDLNHNLNRNINYVYAAKDLPGRTVKLIIINLIYKPILVYIYISNKSSILYNL